jgi:hypothetical protein
MSKTLEDLGYIKEDILNIRKEKLGTRFRDRKKGHVFSFYDENRVFEKPYAEITMEELKAIYQYCIDNKWI